MAACSRYRTWVGLFGFVKGLNQEHCSNRREVSFDQYLDNQPVTVPKSVCRSWARACRLIKSSSRALFSQSAPHSKSLMASPLRRQPSRLGLLKLLACSLDVQGLNEKAACSSCDERKQLSKKEQLKIQRTAAGSAETYALGFA